jgi:hypothetical protein
MSNALRFVAEWRRPGGFSAKLVGVTIRSARDISHARASLDVSPVATDTTPEDTAMTTRTTRPLALAISLGLAAGLLAACGGGGMDSPSTPATGQLSVGITDGPIDEAAKVIIKFSGIELKPVNGTAFSIDFTKSVDLLTLQNGVTSDLTTNASVPAGQYEWMRLKVTATQNVPDSYIEMKTGAQYPLWIPSGMETGLKLVRGFTVAQGSITRLIVDFDLRKSITAPPGQAPNYLMRPALRLLDQLQVGRLAVTVDLRRLTTAQFDANTAISTCKAGLYLYPGDQAKADDFYADATSGNPIVYLPVVYDGVSPTTTVNISFVEAATYKLAATCNYDKDIASTDDFKPDAPTTDPLSSSMKWTPLVSATVTANATTAVTLPPAP